MLKGKRHNLVHKVTAIEIGPREQWGDLLMGWGGWDHLAWSGLRDGAESAGRLPTMVCTVWWMPVVVEGVMVGWREVARLEP